jgi:hypothetical protein
MSNFRKRAGGKTTRLNLPLLATGAALIAVIAAGISATIAEPDNPFSEEKQAFYERLINPPTPDPALELLSGTPIFPSPYEQSGAPDGLYDYGQAPFPAALYSFRNHWRAHVDGEPVVIYAGKLGYESKDPGRGVLVIDSRPFSPMSHAVAPPGAGALRIVDGQDGVLTITSESGAIFNLDIETRKFTDENGDPVPTDTPTPTPPPLPTPLWTLPPFPFDTPTPTATATPSPLSTVSSAAD